jgi:Spy/CpxP family protein refolding chaperone
MTPEQQELMQQFREATTQLRLSAEQGLGKILDKKQATRLKQIQLQLDPQGPWIVLRDDISEKLNLSEEQVAMLTEIRDGQRQKERELRKTNRETMDAVMKKASPDFVGFNRGNRGNRGNNGNNGNAANNGGGQNGNQGNRQPFDPAAFQKAREEMQKIMEIPEVKDAREKQRESEKSIENESYSLITKNLYPRQRTTLKNMVGPPFDRSVMGVGGPFGGRFGGGGAAAAKNETAKGKTATAVAKKTNADDDDEQPAATTTAKPAAKAKAAATAPRRKSLRELRNGSDDE